MMETSDWTARISQRLRLKDLHVFFAVAQFSSMARAAVHLRMTQPAVTKVIAGLEDIFGVVLFDRSSKGVEITAFGRELLKCGTSVFDELRQGTRNIESLGDPTAGELRIGCLVSITAVLLPRIIQRFSRQYPRVIFDVDDLPASTDQQSALRERKYDLALTRLVRPIGADNSDLNVDVLFDDRMVIVAGTQSKWARRRKLDLSELIGEPWILAPSYTWNFSCLMEAFHKRGLQMPKARVVSLSMPLRAELVANGPYVTAVAMSALQSNILRSTLKILPINLPDRIGQVAILTLKRRTLTPIAEHFIVSAREIAATIRTR